MSSDVDRFVVFNLREIYHELGEYEFKIVLSPKSFKNSHLSDVTISDSDGRSILQSTKKWGRKINCVFRIDESVSDGVSVIRLFLKDKEGCSLSRSLSFWIVKP